MREPGVIIFLIALTATCGCSVPELKETGIFNTIDTGETCGRGSTVFDEKSLAALLLDSDSQIGAIIDKDKISAIKGPASDLWGWSGGPVAPVVLEAA
jgi:hypothetical protein